MSPEPSPAAPRGTLAAVQEFLRLEAAGGIVLCAAAALGFALANSPFGSLYDAFLDLRVEIRIGAFEIAKPLLLWINDGLMAIFFFLVGLEVKREIMEGELSRPAQVALPLAGAIGGMAAPAALYLAIAGADPAARAGWAIPTATDIAFAFGVLALLGKRVPPALKIFLLTLAIADDLGAIVIIAFFYSGDLGAAALSTAAACLAVLAVLNRRGVRALAPYLLVAVLMWAAVLKSGVHATLAGVAAAFFIPLRASGGEASPLRALERDLHGTVAFGVLPVFAFANAGVPLAGMTLAALAAPVTLGVAGGLIAGKFAGVFVAVLFMLKVVRVPMPRDASLPAFAGVALLCGVGFTMSLFIGSLAFSAPAEQALLIQSRIGILAGSLISAMAGYALLNAVLPRPGTHARGRATGADSC